MSSGRDASFQESVSRNKPKEHSSKGTTYNHREVWLIVRKGDRRELVKADMTRDLSRTAGKRTSQIPRRRTNPLAIRSDPMNPKHEALTASYSALSQRESKIPLKPAIFSPKQNDCRSLCDKKIIADESPQASEESVKAFREAPLNERCAEIDERIQKLHDRLDQLTERFRQKDSALTQRLKMLHRDLNNLDPEPRPSTSMMLRMLLSLTGHPLIGYILFGCLVYGSRKEALASESETQICSWTPDCLQSPEGKGDDCKELSTPSSFSFTAALACGLSWANLLKQSSFNQQKGKQQQSSQTSDKICVSTYNQGCIESPCREKDKWTRETKAFWPPQAVVRSAFQDSYWVTIGNRISQLSSKKAPSHTPRGMFGKNPGLNRNTFKTILSSSALNEKKFKSPYKTFACHHTSTCSFSEEIEFYKDESIVAYDSSRVGSDELDLSERLLEAIKPEVNQCSLSHLEAVSDMAFLDPVASWSGDSVNCLHSWDSGQMDKDMHSVSSLVSIPEEDVQSNLEESRFSIQNPFFDSLPYDTWYENEISVEFPIPHPSPNLLYGYQTVDSETIHSASLHTAGEIKTKWISVNDFA